MGITKREPRKYAFSGGMSAVKGIRSAIKEWNRSQYETRKDASMAIISVITVSKGIRKSFFVLCGIGFNYEQL
jgi:hypothetical protein